VNATAAEARRALDANPAWYHSIELAPGVVTPGQVDLRAAAATVLPSDLFELAAAALGSRAKRRLMSVYELTPEAIGGPVDFAFSGAILLHLRDPVRALERVAEVLGPGGELRLLEPFSPRLTLLSPRRPAASFGAAAHGFTWWLPNLAALGGWLRAAGLRDERRLAVLRPPRSGPIRHWQAAYSARA
jgi:hypothetical protein